MTTFTRTDKKTKAVTELTLKEAVDQFILDNLDYAQPEEGITPEEALEDMVSVFETRAELNDLEDGDELDAGYFIYAKKN